MTIDPRIDSGTEPITETLTETALRAATTTKIGRNLLLLYEQQATGELVITHGRQANLQWRLYFYSGRLLYATGGAHPVRRWYRAFKHYCPEVFSLDWLINAQSDEALWEVDLLNQALNRHEISLTQGKAIIQAIVQEVMFTILGEKFITTQWNPGNQIPQKAVFLSVAQVIYEAQKLRQQWQDSGLGFLQELVSQFSPDLAPVLRSRPLSENTSPPSKGIMQMMKGQLTFWDLSLELKRSLPEVLRALSPLIRQGVVELREIADLPSPCPQPELSAATSAANQPLIACIDDNPITIRAIAQILKPYGYEVLSVLNPLKDIGTLLERKPDVILLDPNLANGNGYDFCMLLRKSPVFQSTPIVILTRQDGMIDRMRARLAGASEFLSKPLEPAQVVQVVQKHLKAEAKTIHTSLQGNSLASCRVV
ncbi:MAG: response regulator [Drouetiella hepatica Uher 2000/2452]|uniref:Response regulator n=1 Tax=Drouetiella hepatica Uher 2000/2452 TaxID=904376 RepID=A0A951QEX3_9CYAN|nr:response regulator [Drouetiella hepatica Uher 2000/2452]